METLLLLTYAAICVVVFKVFRIPLNKWTVPTAVLGGMVLVGAIVFAMNYNHPYSGLTRQYFFTTPIIPDVAGTVISVEARGNEPLQQGDVMFRIDPAPFQDRVADYQAQLVSASEDLARARALAERQVGNQRDVDLAQAQVDEITARLAEARFKLERTVVRAPTDGYLTQFMLQPGMRALPMPLRPVAVFLHQREPVFVGWFRQNSLLRLEIGNAAEVAFDAIPGRVFQATVEEVLPALREGQLQPSGDLMAEAPAAGMPGRVPVVLRVTDPDFDDYHDKLPGGSFAQSAVYSDHLAALAVIRRILLRMSAWLNYLFPIH